MTFRQKACGKDSCDCRHASGKTGTSNNHSDAWFIGISPRLVCGAWVGGEYRAIHFRTGLLGQGSKTALPICGRFLQAVLGDDRFKNYHAKFETCRDTTIDATMYQCIYYRDPLDSIMNSFNDLLINGDDTEFMELSPTDEEAPATLDDPVVNNTEATEQ